MTTAKWTLVTVVAVLVVIALASALYVVEEPEFAIVPTGTGVQLVGTF